MEELTVGERAELEQKMAMSNDLLTGLVTLIKLKLLIVSDPVKVSVEICNQFLQTENWKIAQIAALAIVRLAEVTPELTNEQLIGFKHVAPKVHADVLVLLKTIKRLEGKKENS
jgi:hypothetical protein